MRRALFVLITLSSVFFADIIRNGDIVADTKTGLQWQDDSAASTLTKSWEAAITYCENLTLGGYTDWRLPNINELKTIVDINKTPPAVVNGFVNVVPYLAYWSSTTKTDQTQFGRVVVFGSGETSYIAKGAALFVRCVRTGR